MRKKIIFIILFHLCVSVKVYTQSQTIIESPKNTTLIIWCSDPNFGRIKVNVNGTYSGDITSFYNSTPSCGAAGCVTVSISGSGRTIIRAFGNDGTEFYKEINSLSANKCNSLRLTGTPKKTTSSSTSETKSSSSSSFDDYASSVLETNPTSVDPTADAIIALAALTGIGLAFASNEIYVNYIEGISNYYGFSFGLSNSVNSHINVEYGASRIKEGKLWGEGYEFPQKLWIADINFAYNFFARKRDDYHMTIYEPLVNPYMGVTSSLICKENPQLGFGFFVGLSVGKRLRGHIRYKWMKDFANNLILYNQIEVGLSVTYKYGWKFKKHSHVK
ncbi:hypothetical protein LJC11_00855 [Bacteroidales bacterium OttesenSCG-928-I21]|nr:hypothetical protein [Bacteroidales bacterium OttesenSCG-928-I21]